MRKLQRGNNGKINKARTASSVARPFPRLTLNFPETTADKMCKKTQTNDFQSEDHVQATFAHFNRCVFMMDPTFHLFFPCLVILCPFFLSLFLFSFHLLVFVIFSIIYLVFSFPFLISFLLFYCRHSSFRCFCILLFSYLVCFSFFFPCSLSISSVSFLFDWDIGI